jgi:hypothetical protein
VPPITATAMTTNIIENRNPPSTSKGHSEGE